MRSGVAIVAMGVVAGMVLVPFCTAMTLQSAEDAQITDVNATGAPQGNVSQPTPSNASQTVPVNASGQTTAASPAATTAYAATNTTPSGGQVTSPDKTVNTTAAPESMNTTAASQFMNTSTATPHAMNISPTPPRATNTSSVVPLPNTSSVTPQPVITSTAPIIPGRQGVPIAVFAPNITIAPSATVTPESTNVSAPATAPRRPRRAANYTQARRVTRGAEYQQAACPQECANAQQQAASTKAATQFRKRLGTLTDMYTKFPSFYNDAEEEPLQNTTGALQNPLEKFGMCTLIAKIGEESGPVTVLVAAEDEQRMRAAGSYYQVGKVYPEKQRAFTSFCPGREDLYLTFNPKRGQ